MVDFRRGETLWARTHGRRGTVFSFTFHSSLSVCKQKNRFQAIVRGHRHDNGLPVARPNGMIAKDPLDLLSDSERAEYPSLDPRGHDDGGEG